MEPDLDNCFFLLNQTFALAEHLNLRVFIGIELLDRRCWSANGRDLQFDFMSNKFTFDENDLWLKSGKMVGQRVIGRDQLFNLNENELSMISDDGGGHPMSSPPLEGGMNNVLAVSRRDDENLVKREIEGDEDEDDVELELKEEEEERNVIDEINDDDRVRPDECRTPNKAGNESKSKDAKKRSRSLSCRKCHVTFPTKSDVEFHFKDVHCKCEQCGRRFKKIDYLQKHVRNVHSKLKPYECHKCGMRFGHTSAKSTHVNSDCGRNHIGKGTTSVAVEEFETKTIDDEDVKDPIDGDRDKEDFWIDSDEQSGI